MEDFVHDALREHLDGFTLVGWKAVDDFFYFLLADGFELVAQLLNRRRYLQSVIPLMKLQNLFVNNLLDFSGLCFSFLEISVDDDIQCIDVVQKHVVDFVCGGVDVAWNSDIDDK